MPLFREINYYKYTNFFCTGITIPAIIYPTWYRVYVSQFVLARLMLHIGISAWLEHMNVVLFWRPVTKFSTVSVSVLFGILWKYCKHNTTLITSSLSPPPKKGVTVRKSRLKWRWKMLASVRAQSSGLISSQVKPSRPPSSRYSPDAFKTSSKSPIYLKMQR